AHFQRDVVFGDDILGRDIDRDHSGIYPVQAFDARDHKDQPRPAYRLKFPQTQHHTAFPFAQQLDGVGEDNDEDNQYKQWPCTLHSYASSATVSAVGALAPFLCDSVGSGRISALPLWPFPRSTSDPVHSPRAPSLPPRWG